MLTYSNLSRPVKKIHENVHYFHTSVFPMTQATAMLL